jgi:CBS domain-containing protein
MFGTSLFSPARRVVAPLPFLLGAVAVGAIARRVAGARRAGAPLARYLGRRVIVLHASDFAYAAGRAMAANGVGAVLVERGGEVVGVVTDRDLALYLCGGHAGREATLRDVMCVITAAAPPTASIREVIALMKRTGVRRVPILDARGKAVGIVTLDDLLADRAISPRDAEAIVRAQLELPASQKRAGELGPTRPARPWLRRSNPEDRRASRAEATRARALDLVAAYAGLPTRAAAEAAFLAVVGTLLQRLHPGEAAHLLAQLPSLLREQLEVVPGGPDRSIDFDRLCAAARDVLAAEDARYAARIVRGIVRALDELVSPGELAQVFEQLPVGLRSALCAALPAPLNP